MAIHTQDSRPGLSYDAPEGADLAAYPGFTMTPLKGLTWRRPDGARHALSLCKVRTIGSRSPFGKLRAGSRKLGSRSLVN